MKITYKKLGLISLILLLVSFTVIQTLEQDKDLIIGTWIPEGSPNSEWVFISKGKCYEYNKGQLDETYNYSIIETKSSNGKFTLNFLKTINLNDPNDIYEYEINSISDTEMYLDYQGDLNTNLLKFTRK
jgi:hypothetical protein